MTAGLLAWAYSAGVVAAALGTAIGSSLTIFPLTYITAKRHFDLPPLSGARRIWAAYFGAQVVTTLLVGVPENAPVSDIPVLLMVPVLVSLTVLFFYSWARSVKSPVGASDRINYRRGLLRIWVLLTLGWSVFVLAVGGLQSIEYAWRYQFDYEVLRHEQAALGREFGNSNDFVADSGRAAATSDSSHQSLEYFLHGGASSRAATFATTSRAAPANFTLDDAIAQVQGEAPTPATLRNSLSAQPDREAQFQAMAKLAGVPMDTARAQPDVVKTQTAPIQAPTPAPEPPDWTWLEWLLLPPTVGIAVSVTVLAVLWQGLRNLLRWVHRGFVG